MSFPSEELNPPFKGEDESVTNDITRELIKGLPRLFIKHQTDQKRIADVLMLPTLMNLDLYLEMRMIAVRLLTRPAFTGSLFTFLVYLGVFQPLG